MKTYLILLCFCVFGTRAGDIPGSPLKLKLTALRAEYVIDRDGKSVAEYAEMLRTRKLSQPGLPSAIALMVELKNTGAEKLTVFGAPRPRFILKGPQAESVVETYGAHFYGTPSRLIELEPGQSVLLHEINFMFLDGRKRSATGHGQVAVEPAEAIAPIGSLGYTVGNATTNVYWTEAGTYTLHAVFSGGVTPGPAGALPFDDNGFPGERSQLPKSLTRLDVSSAPVTLTVRDGDMKKYWMEALEDANADVRVVAAATLAPFQSKAGPICAALALCLKDVDARVRHQAAETINSLYQESNAPQQQDEALRTELCGALLTRLKDDVPTVREAAVRALASVVTRTSNPSQIKNVNAAVVPLLRDGIARVRMSAASVLGGLRWQRASVPAVIAALLDALADKEESVVVSALNALGLHGADAAGAVPVIQRSLREGSLHLRSSAIIAAARIGASARVVLPEIIAALKDNELRGNAVAAIQGIGTNVEGLLPALEGTLNAEQDYHTRVQIVQAMGKVCGAAAIPAIRKTLLQDKKDYVRDYAAQTLGYIDDPAAVTTLMEALRDPSQKVRITAIDALRSLKRRAQPAMDMLEVVRTSDADEAVRERSAVALREIGAVIEVEAKK
jgi:HEAT repeat protein